MLALDLTGLRFGTFTALRRLNLKTSRCWRWAAVCDCGTETTARSTYLTSGRTRCPNCQYRRNGRGAWPTEFVTESGCEIWLGSINSSGYGHFWRDGRYVGAHREAWQRERGPIPDGLWVLHRRDVRCCVNVDHLFLGTHIENMADMMRKRRHACFRHRN